MHLLFLGVFKSLIALVFLVVRVLDIDKKFIQYVSESMDIMIKSGINFSLLEKLRDNKTTR